MTPRERVAAYVRLFRGRYLIGALVTVAYAIVFQMVPLAVRNVVAEISKPEPSAAVTGAALWLVGVSVVFAVLSFA